MCMLSQLFATPWTVARQAPLSMGFSRQEYWNRLPFPVFPPLGEFPNLDIEPVSPALQVNSLPAEPSRKCYKDLQPHHMLVQEASAPSPESWAVATFVCVAQIPAQEHTPPPPELSHWGHGRQTVCSYRDACGSPWPCHFLAVRSAQVTYFFCA